MFVCVCVCYLFSDLITRLFHDAVIVCYLSQTCRAKEERRITGFGGGKFCSESCTNCTGTKFGECSTVEIVLFVASTHWSQRYTLS